MNNESDFRKGQFDVTSKSESGVECGVDVLGAIGVGEVEFVGNGAHLGEDFEWSDALWSEFVHWLGELEVRGV